jgi:hypothetical protein
MRRRRPPRPGPPDADPWPWLLERLADPTHPEHRRGIWWARTLVLRFPAPTDPTLNRGIAAAVWRLAKREDRSTPVKVMIEAARTAMEMDWSNMKLARTRQILDRLDCRGDQ